MTRNERLQAIFHLYESERGHQPATAREAVEWAVSEDMLALPVVDPFDSLAAQMASALREEFDTHNGRRYRVNHAARVQQNGEQQTFWAIMGHAPHEHMERAFAQRREHIIGECVQLNTDVTVYNEMNAGQRPPIQVLLDFRDDVAERSQQD
jgi:hypothetical protein